MYKITWAAELSCQDWDQNLIKEQVQTGNMMSCGIWMHSKLPLPWLNITLNLWMDKTLQEKEKKKMRNVKEQLGPYHLPKLMA